MRLIDADMLRSDWLENGQNEYIYDTNAILNSIDLAPAIDAELVRHGRWVMTEYEYFNCSLCGRSFYNGCDSTREAKRKLKDGDYYQYCPNCGAKMDLEGSE